MPSHDTISLQEFQVLLKLEQDGGEVSEINLPSEVDHLHAPVDESTMADKMIQRRQI